MAGPYPAGRNDAGAGRAVLEPRGREDDSFDRCGGRGRTVDSMSTPTDTSAVSEDPAAATEVRVRADRHQERLAVGAALITVVLWASAFVGIRSAGEDFSGGALSLGRLVVGSLVLGALVLVRRERLPPRRDVPGLLLCGVLWFGIYNVALNEAERRVDAGTAAMLVNVGPILIAVLAGVVLQEGFPRTLLVGCAVAFAGVVVIGLATSENGVTASWGAALCLLAALAYAGGVVAQKPLLGRSSALSVTWLACTIGAVACLPFAPTLVDELGEARSSTVWWILYLGAGPTAVAFTWRSRPGPTRWPGPRPGAWAP